MTPPLPVCRCYTFNLPPSCQMVGPAPGHCCKTPSCPSGVDIQYPPGYVVNWNTCHNTEPTPPPPPPPLTITLSPVAIHHLRNKTFHRIAAVQFHTSPSLLAGDPVSWLVTSCPFWPGCPVLTWMSAEKPSTIPNPLTDDYHFVLNTPNSSRYVNWSIQHDIYTPSSEAALLTLKSSSLLAMTSTESDHNTYPPTNDCLSDVDI